MLKRWRCCVVVVVAFTLLWLFSTRAPEEMNVEQKEGIMRERPGVSAEEVNFSDRMKRLKCQYRCVTVEEFKTVN